MGELGSILREARESKGLSLEQVEQSTRIRRAFLEALEEGRFHELPGEVYAKGFIRNYASFLGLDPEEPLAAYRDATGTPTAPSIPLVLDEPLMRRTSSHVGATIFLAIMVILFFALIGWYVYRRFYLGVDPWPFVIAWPVAPTAATSILSSATPLAGVSLPTFTKQAQSFLAAPTMPSTSESMPIQRVTSTPQPMLSPSPILTITPTPTLLTPIRVEAQVLARTYVEVSVDGELILVKTLNVGDDMAWEAERSVSMHIGNAAGLRLVVNGIPMDPLGRQGEVVDVEYRLGSLPQG